MNYILKQPMRYGYTQISNDICEDERVSDIAIAIYAYIKKHATTFKLCLEDIAKRFNRSLPTVHKYLNELKDLGYLEFERERKSDGTFGKFLRFFLANHSKNPSVKQSKNTANQNKTILLWSKPQKEASNADNTEAQSTSKNFNAFTLKKNQNKHENIHEMHACGTFSNQELEETNEVFEDEQVRKNPNQKLTFKRSKIFKPSLFNRFSAFFSSILGNLDTKHLNQYERSAFEEFLNYRSEKHQLSYSTKKALLKQCEALKAQGCDLVACIDQSIRRNYNEIYEVMHFEKPSYKSEAEQKNDEVMSHFDFKGSNPKFGGYCIW
ncbi:winged helix-turn-helix domain-containing protein [Helicobacter pylori]|nr:winged helix-turn-helix domain-containing protein [Helicobacter pylori]